MGLRDILIKIGGDTSQYEQSMRDIKLHTKKTTQFISTAWIKAGVSIYGAYKIWEAGKLGAKMQQERQSFDNLAASYGRTGESIINELRQASAETVDMMTVVNKAGTAMMMGLNPADLAKLMKIARATSRQTGQSVTQAFEDISLAVGRQSRMILDNLGIIVRVEDANKKYAEKLGKTTAQLTDAEKKQAFLNATISAGEDLINRIGGEAITGAEKMQQMEAAAKDLKNQFSAFASELTTAVAPAMNDILGYWTDILEMKNWERKYNASDLGKKQSEAAQLREEMNRLEDQMERRRKYFEQNEKDVYRDRYYSGLDVKHAKAEYEYNKLLSDIKKISMQQNKPKPPPQPEETPQAAPGWPSAGMTPWAIENYFDKGWEDLLKKESEKQKKRIELAEDVTDKIKELTLDETEFKKWMLDREMADLRQAAGEDKQILDQIEKYHKLALKNISDNAEKTFGQEIFDATKGWAVGFSSQLNDLLWESEATFDGIAKAYGKMITQIMLERSAMRLMDESGDWFKKAGQWIGNYFSNRGSTASAHGNVFAGAGINAYENKIVSRPVIFPFARGIGLMGEGTRPEAILPLTRTSTGNLGVEAKVGGGQTVVHHYDFNGTTFLDQATLTSTMRTISNDAVRKGSSQAVMADYRAGEQIRDLIRHGP